MSKNKFLIAVVIGLIVTNLLVIGLVVLRKPHRPPVPKPPKEIIIERLGFNENQIKKYEALIEEHRQAIDEKDRVIRETKNMLYSQLKGNESSYKDSLIDIISKAQRDIEYLHFKHFSDIKSICTNDQMEKYNDLVNELGRIFSPMKPLK